MRNDSRHGCSSGFPWRCGPWLYTVLHIKKKSCLEIFFILIELIYSLKHAKRYLHNIVTELQALRLDTEWLRFGILLFLFTFFKYIWAPWLHKYSRYLHENFQSRKKQSRCLIIPTQIGVGVILYIRADVILTGLHRFMLKVFFMWLETWWYTGHKYPHTFILVSKVWLLEV